MKKYILAFLPIMGLNAQVTIGEPSENNTAAMLNITKPNTVFIVPVANASLSSELSLQNAVTIAPEGSMIYLRDNAVNNTNGIHFRIADASNTSSLTGTSTNLKWSPFRKNKKTYIYNNVKRNVNEQLLGYSSEDYPNQALPYNCFRWETGDPNDPNTHDALANGHVYCLVQNSVHGQIPNPTSNSPQYLCTSSPTELVGNTVTLPINEPAYDGTRVRVDRGTIGGYFTSNPYRRYTIKGNWKKTETSKTNTTYTRQGNQFDWTCAFATAHKDKGYLATITSYEEYQKVLSGLSTIVRLNPAINLDYIAIGLRNIVNNEGDRTTYQTQVFKKKKMWVNGEQNDVNWLSSTYNNTLPISNNTSTIDIIESPVSPSNYKTKNVIKTITSSTTYSTQDMEVKIRIYCNVMGGRNSCDRTGVEVLKLYDSWVYESNSPRATTSNPSNSETTTMTYAGNDSSDCGAIRFDASSSKFVLGDCDLGTYQHVLIEYNN